MKLGDKLKEKRLDAGLTQKELADTLHVSRQTISSWEVGRTFPDLTILVTLSDIYDIPLDDLVKEDSRLVDHITEKVKKSERRKYINIVLSFLLTAATIFLVYLGLQQHQATQINEYGLSPSDIYNSTWEVHYDPTRELGQSFISFDNNRAGILNIYDPRLTTPNISDEERADFDETWLARGLEDGLNTYRNLEVDVDEETYIVSAQGLRIEFTRLSSTIIRNEDGIEYHRVLDESTIDDLSSIDEWLTEENETNDGS